MGMNETLKAISDPVRRDILQNLKSGKKSAGEIAEQFNLTGATVSYHLSKLKAADLITEDFPEKKEFLNVIENRLLQMTKIPKRYALFNKKAIEDLNDAIDKFIK